MPALIPPVAAQLRAIVQAEGRAHLLDRFTDEQLLDMAVWIKEGKTSELIGRAICEVWTAANGTFWPTWVDPLNAYRSAIYEGDPPIANDIITELDPIAENASFIRELRAVWRKWNRKAQRPSAKASVLERADRIAKLICDSIKNHVYMQDKHRLTPQGPAKELPGKTNVSIEQMQVVCNELGGDDMPDFINSVVARLETTGKAVKQLPKANSEKE